MDLLGLGGFAFFDHEIIPNAHGPSYGGVWGLKALGFEGRRAVWSVWVRDFCNIRNFSPTLVASRSQWMIPEDHVYLCRN